MTSSTISLSSLLSIIVMIIHDSSYVHVLPTVLADPTLTWYTSLDPSPLEHFAAVTAKTTNDENNNDASSSSSSSLYLPSCDPNSIFHYRHHRTLAEVVDDDNAGRDGISNDGINDDNSSSGNNNSKNDTNNNIFMDAVKNVFMDAVHAVVVDGCLLDCQGKMIRRSIEGTAGGAGTAADANDATDSDHPSILYVRNGGRVKDCSIVLLADAAPATNETTNTSASPILIDGGGNEYPLPVSGIVCDSGDCTLEGVSCGLDTESPNSGNSRYYFVECIRIAPGARKVRIEGGRVIGGNSEHGIVINSGTNATSAEYYYLDRVNADDDNKDNNLTTVSIQDFEIRNVFSDGILILGGPRSIRITDCTLAENKGDGIELRGGGGIEYLAIFGGTIENNGDDGIDVQQNDHFNVNFGNNSTDYIHSPIVEVAIAGTIISGNAEDGILIDNADKVTVDGVETRGNGDDGIDIKWATSITLQGVVSKNNAQNGLACEALGADLTVADCVFVKNGLVDADTEAYERAGVYLWLLKEIKVSNTVSNNNGKNGFSLHDVQFLNMTDVDVFGNGNDGLQIQKSADSEYEDGIASFTSEIVFTRFRACNNGNDGIELFVRSDTWGGSGDGSLNFTPMSGVVSCGNKDYDFELYGGGKLAFIPPPSSSFLDGPTVAGDWCRNDDAMGGCDDLHYKNCSAKVCQPRDIVSSSSGEVLN